MESLAEFIQQRREKAGLSIIWLAKKTNIKLETLEDIESGKELFLSVTQRQQIARVLKCSPKELKSHEKDYKFEIVQNDTIEELKTKGGFGYDPLFFYKGFNKTFGEATPEEKNEISHRGNALKKLKEKLI